MIGIEEASSKRTFLYTVPHAAKDIAHTDKQLADLKVNLSHDRVISSDPKPTTKLVYVINGPQELRVKWTEMHKRVQAVRRTREFRETNVPKVIVLIVNKTTGLVHFVAIILKMNTAISTTKSPQTMRITPTFVNSRKTCSDMHLNQ